MNDALASALVKGLLEDVETDIRLTEDYPDDFAVFHPSIWLDNPTRRYIPQIIQISSKKPSATAAVLLETIVARLKDSGEQGSRASLRFKFILVLSTLLTFVPECDVGAEANAALSEIICGNLLSRVPARVIAYVEAAVVTAVRIGASPQLTARDANAFAALSYFFPNLCHSPAAFTAICAVAASSVVDFPLELRTRFVEQFYTAVAHFFGHFPTIYTELLLSGGLPQAQALVDAVLGWKSTPDSEHLCLLAAFIPFCQPALQAYARAPKQHPFFPVFQGLTEVRQKKDGPRFSIACGILEFFNAVVVGSPSKDDVFKPLSDMLVKTTVKLEVYMFEHKKKKDAHTSGKLLTHWMPRWTALSFAKNANGINSAAVRCLWRKLELATRPAHEMLGALLELLDVGYPAPVDSKPLRSKIVPKLVSRLGDALWAFVQGQAGAAFETSDGLVRFFASDVKQHSADASAALCGAVTQPPPHPYFQSVRHLSRSLATLVGLARAVFSVVAVPMVDDITPFVNWLRFFFMTDSALRPWVRNAPLKDVSTCVAQLAKVVAQKIEQSYLVASPTFFRLGTLLYAFLKWSKFVLAHAHERDLSGPGSAFFGQMMETILLLYGFVEDGLIGACDAELCEIYEIYDVAPTQSAFEIIKASGEPFATALKVIMSGWLGRIAKQLSSEQQTVSIPQLSPLPPSLSCSRERIAVITAHLARYVTVLAEQKGQSGESIPAIFASVCVKYLVATKIRDEAFSRAFSALDPDVTRLLVDEIADAVKSMWRRELWVKPVFWVNTLPILSAVIAKASIAELGLINLVVPSFSDLLRVTKLEGFGAEFVEQFPGFVRQLSASAFIKGPTLWLRISTTMIDTAFVCRGAGRADLVDRLVDCFPVLFTRLRFSIASEIYNVDALSDRNDAVRDIAWTVTQLVNFLDTPKHCLCVRKALDEIIANNFAIAWPVYISMLASGEDLTRAILMDSLATAFGAFSLSKTSEPEAVAPNSPRLTRVARAMRAKLPKSDGADAAAFFDAAHYASRSLTPPPAPAEFGYTFIVANDFAFFLDPPTKNVRVVQAAVALAIAYHMHDRVFAAVTDAFASRRSLTSDSTFPLFYTAWFKQLAVPWDLNDFIGFARVSTLDSFISHAAADALFVLPSRLPPPRQGARVAVEAFPRVLPSAAACVSARLRAARLARGYARGLRADRLPARRFCEADLVLSPGGNVLHSNRGGRCPPRGGDPALCGERPPSGGRPFLERLVHRLPSRAPAAGATAV
jgi:hypothetical protein